MAQLTEGLVVEWVADSSGTPGSVWSKVPDIIKIPTLVGTPSTHEVTTIYDKMKTYIEGLPDNGGILGFGINFTKEAFDEVKKMEAAQKTDDIWMRVGMAAPINQAYQFRCTVAPLANDEWSPDNPMQGTLNVTATTGIDLVEYSAG